MVRGDRDDDWDGTVTDFGTIRQFVPAVYPRDAVGGHVLRLAQALTDLGFDAPVFVEETVAETAAHTADISTLGPPGAGAVNLYHVATGSALVDILVARPEPLVTVHHNLTPVELMAPWDPEQVHQLTLARRQLETLARASSLGIADSEFNRRELERLGFTNTAVAPIVFEPAVAATEPRGEARTNRAQNTVLFVGRLAPNKGQHDLVKAIGLLADRLANVRLRLVGADATPRYTRSLQNLIRGLGLSEIVTLVGAVDDRQLEREYESADVLCCLSDHEGFGMPIIEAMARGIPVVAFSSSAVPETAGDAALVLPHKDPATVAVALERVLTSPELAQALSAAGLHRAEEFSAERAVQAYLSALSSIGTDETLGQGGAR